MRTFIVVPATGSCARAERLSSLPFLVADAGIASNTQKSISRRDVTLILIVPSGVRCRTACCTLSRQIRGRPYDLASVYRTVFSRALVFAIPPLLAAANLRSPAINLVQSGLAAFLTALPVFFAAIQ